MIMKNRNRSTGLLLWKLLCALLLPSVCQAGHYSNFVVSVYCRAYEVRQMTNLVWLSNVWNTVGSQLKVDKVYLESYRDGIIPDRETIATAKRFFESRGIR